MTEDEARKELEGDTLESLKSSHEEYCPTIPIPTDKPTLIANIIEAMKQEGHIITTQTFKLSNLARDLNINPKVARDKMRRADAKGKAPQSIKAAGWVFNTNDRQQIINIIQRKEPQDGKL